MQQQVEGKAEPISKETPSHRWKQPGLGLGCGGYSGKLLAFTSHPISLATLPAPAPHPHISL